MSENHNVLKEIWSKYIWSDVSLSSHNLVKDQMSEMASTCADLFGDYLYMWCVYMYMCRYTCMYTVHMYSHVFSVLHLFN